MITRRKFFSAVPLLPLASPESTAQPFEKTWRDVTQRPPLAPGRREFGATGILGSLEEDEIGYMDLAATLRLSLQHALRTRGLVAENTRLLLVTDGKEGA